MQIEVGKKYEDQHGHVVEIVAHNDLPSASHKAFIGLCDRGGGFKYARCYGAKGEAFVPLVREHVPFELEVGKAYPMRGGSGYGVVLCPHDDGFAALVKVFGFSPMLGFYNVRGLSKTASLLGELDLVPGKLDPTALAAAAAALVASRFLSCEDSVARVDDVGPAYIYKGDKGNMVRHNK